MAAALCLLTAAPALASKPPSLKWSGLSAEGAPGWSIDENWSGDSAPTAKEALATLEFPRLSSCASEEHPCYEGENDVSELSVEALHIDDGDSYELWGNELALGAGGLTASPASGSKGAALDLLELPLWLSATQRWSISGRGNGEINGLELEGAVTGATSTDLTLELGKQAVLALEGDEVEAGRVSIAGASSAKAGFENGLAVLAEGDIDATDEQPVELSHILFSGSGKVGSLTTKDAELAVGDGIEPAGGIDATNITLDAGSEVAFEIAGGDDLAKSDYSQLTSQGAVDLASAKIAVDVGPPSENQPCPALTVGQTYTFVSTSATLSGAFGNAPDNGAEIPIHFAAACTPAPLSMRISYQETGERDTVTGTVETEPVITESPASVKVTEGESAVFKAAATGAKSVQWEVKKGASGSFEDDTGDHGNTEDTLTVEHASSSENGYEYRAVFENDAGKEAVTAAAVLTVEPRVVITEIPPSTNATAGAKHEEETAKGGVLSAKEGSPDATIASTSLTVSSPGAFVVRVECPAADTSCAGTITIRTLHAVLASASGRAAKQKATVLTLAAGSFTVAGGQSKALTLHLSAVGTKLLAHTHVLSARATIVAHDPTGGANTASTVVTLRAARTKRGKG